MEAYEGETRRLHQDADPATPFDQGTNPATPSNAFFMTLAVCLVLIMAAAIVMLVMTLRPTYSFAFTATIGAIGAVILGVIIGAIIESR